MFAIPSDMLEERSHEGYWWLPDNEENIVGGVVNYSPKDGIWLETFSALNIDPEYLGSDNVFRPPVIHGTTTRGENITLRRCARNQYNLASQGQATGTPSEYLVLEMVEGIHYDPSEPEFTSVQATFPLMADWARISGISRPTGSMIDDPEDGDSIDLHYEVPETISTDLDDFTLSIRTDFSVNLNLTGGATIEEVPYVIIEPSSGELPYYEALELIGTFQDFLTLGTGKELQPEGIKGTIEDDDGDEIQVQVIHPLPGGPHDPDSMHPLKANFILGDIIEDIDNVVSQWFSHADELKPVFDSYFGVLYNSTLYAQNQFLALTRAVESYHRESYPDKYLDEDDFGVFYEVMVESIPDDLPDDFRDHLEGGTLKYANEYSLRKRLTLLTDELEEFIEDYPWDIQDEVGPITDTRNYLTHHDESISGAEPDRLSDFILMLQAILETILLRDIDIPQDQIKERVSQRYAERTR